MKQPSRHARTRSVNWWTSKSEKWTLYFHLYEKEWFNNTSDDSSFLKFVYSFVTLCSVLFVTRSSKGHRGNKKDRGTLSVIEVKYSHFSLNWFQCDHHSPFSWRFTNRVSFRNHSQVSRSLCSEKRGLHLYFRGVKEFSTPVVKKSLFSSRKFPVTIIIPLLSVVSFFILLLVYNRLRKEIKWILSLF